MTDAAQRAWRILRDLPRYCAGNEAGERAQAEGVHIPADEELLGVYDNPGGPALFVTDRSVRWGDGHAVQYNRIAASEVPGEKTDADRLVVTLDNGALVTLPIAGGRGRLRDVWEFKRYLDRVVRDTKPNQ